MHARDSASKVYPPTFPSDVIGSILSGARLRCIQYQEIPIICFGVVGPFARHG
jgi:hypothetical protein